MSYWLAANLVVILHFAFVCFVFLGGLLVFRWRRVIYMHIPAAVWGAWIEFHGGICPLTPLENYLRHAAGQSGYSGGFVEHYILPVLYPVNLDRELQVTLGSIVVGVNLFVYGWLVIRHKKA